MSEEPKIDTSKKVKPTITVTRSPNFGTIAADYAKVMTNRVAQTCTFTFFQRHVIPKITQGGVQAESVEEEMVLEIKMPLNEAFTLALYMTRLLKEIQADPKNSRINFGPSMIEVIKKPSEEERP